MDELYKHLTPSCFNTYTIKPNLIYKHYNHYNQAKKTNNQNNNNFNNN